MAKNRYFHTATFSLFAGVVLVGLTLLASPETARNIYLLSIGQEPTPIVSSDKKSENQQQPEKFITATKPQIPEYTDAFAQNDVPEEIPVSEPELLPESEEVPLALPEHRHWEEESELIELDETQTVRLEQPQLLAPQVPELAEDEFEEITVELDTTELDQRIIHIDQQIDRLEEVETKQRDLLSRSEELFENVHSNLNKQEPEELAPVEEDLPQVDEENTELTDQIDIESNDEGPEIKLNAGSGSTSKTQLVENSFVQLDSPDSESGSGLQIEMQEAESTDPVLIAQKDETNPNLIFLKFENAELKEVFRLLAEVSQANIYIAPELTGPYSGEYRVHDLEEALSKMLPNMGYTFERDDAEVFVMSVEMVKSHQGNPAKQVENRKGLISVQPQSTQQGMIRRMNPNLAPPSNDGLHVLIDHTGSGDQKMGDSDLNEMITKFFNGKPHFADEAEVDKFQNQPVPVLDLSNIVQTDHTEPVKTAHTPQLFKQSPNARPIMQQPIRQMSYQQPAPAANQRVYKNGYQNQVRKNAPPYRQPSYTPQNIRKPVSMPIISVKAF